MILASDNLSVSYRRIIDSILNDVDVYTDIEMLKSITIEDLQNFLTLLKEENRVTSKIISK